MTTLWTLLLPLADVLAKQAPDPEDVKPGWLGFGVFLLLLFALVLLGLSLRKHLGRVDFEEEPDDADDAKRP
jgi:hypothetical protein